MKKVAIYCRVSTQRQEKEATIETQIATLENLYKGKNIVKKYIDNGYTGTNAERPALREMREDIKQKLFDILAIYDASRLARDTVLQLTLVKELREKGIEIELGGKKLEDTPEGALSLTVFAAVAQWEKDGFVRRSRDGKYRIVGQHKILGCYPSYGYKLIKRDKNRGTDARFVIDPKEAKVVRLIFKTYLEEQNIQRTARRITEMGFRSRPKRGSIEKPKPFWPRTISNILKNESYIGNWYFGKHYQYKERDKKVKRLRPKKEWKKVKIPAIIDKITFNRVQETMKERGKRFLYTSKYQYLCQGLIKCLHCSRRYYGKMSVKVFNNKSHKYFSYICGRKYRRLPNKKSCLSKTISATIMDNFVWERVLRLIKYPEKVKEKIRELQEKRAKEEETNRQAYDVLMIEKTKVENKISKILDLFADEKIPQEDLDKKVSELNGQKLALESQIKEVEKELAMIKDKNKVEEEIDKICLYYQGELLKDMTFEEKQSMVRRWVKSITLADDKTITIQYTIPEITLPDALKPQFTPDSSLVKVGGRLVRSSTP